MNKTEKGISRIIVLTIAAFMLVFALGGCDIIEELLGGTVGPQERAESFIEDMNTTLRLNIRGNHIHPDAGNYDQIGEGGAAYWAVYFFLTEVNTFELTDISVSGNVVNATLSSQSQYESGQSITFTMKDNDAGDSMILALSIGSLLKPVQ